MVSNINESINICGTSIHIHSISTSGSSPNKKSYYQHRHPGLEIHYIISGQCKVTCNGNSFFMESESMLLIPPGTYHDVSPTDPNTSRLCISFRIQKMKDKSSNKKTDNFYNIYNQNTPSTADLHDSEAQRILLKMIALLDGVGDGYKIDKLLTLCGYLLLEMIPYIADATPCDKPADPDDTQEDVSFKIDSFLGTNFMHNDAKSRMADDLFVSPRQLQRIIKKNYGMNYREKLAETRVQIAIDLLCNSNLPIHKIAEILGYSCSANFSAFIKRNIGKTPSQIRKER